MDTPAPATDFLSRLHAAFWPLHERFEAQSPLAAVAKGRCSEDHYLCCLKLLYGVVAPLEENISAFCLSQANGDPFYPGESAESWKRLPLLEKDLAALGLSQEDIHSLPHCSNVPLVDNAAAALGFLYLLEGSRLGGKVIAHAVSKHLGLDAHCGCAYFSSNGQEAVSSWNRFKGLLATHAAPDTEEQIIAAALNGFAAVECWFANACHEEADHA